MALDLYVTRSSSHVMSRATTHHPYKQASAELWRQRVPAERSTTYDGFHSEMQVNHTIRQEEIEAPLWDGVPNHLESLPLPKQDSFPLDLFVEHLPMR